MNDDGRRVLGRALGIAIVAGAVVLSLWAWWLTYQYPRTDDALVRANVVGIAPHVAGPITELHVVDNQRVREGDLLFVIDPRPYQATLDQARATLDLTQAEIDAQRDAIAAAQAELERRTAEEGYAADYLKRIEPLLGRGFVTADRVQDARTKMLATRATSESARQERARAEKLLAQVGDLNARLEAAKAAVYAAELNVGYTRVAAPFDAYVTNLNIAVGEYTRQGQQVFALVDDRTWYVMANFRETFMESIRPGMGVEVFLLSYPRRPFRGVVQGIGWALRPDDATGVEGLPRVEPTLNWVRLAQRFPVRIQLDPPDPVRPYRMGATAVVTVQGDRPVR
jgi:multidrug resistance efflux pump